jgi:hypothetical protein
VGFFIGNEKGGRKMAEEVDKLIGYCGYNCHLCAARSEDIAVRQKLVDAWHKYLGHENITFYLILKLK